MFKTIYRPAICEIRSVIKFLNVRNVRPCEIYRQISESQSGPSPSDYHLFSHLKEFLAGQQFASDDEIKINVQNWFRSPAAEFYEAARRKGVDGTSVETPGLLMDPVPISPSSDSLTDALAPTVCKLCHNQAFCGLCDAQFLCLSTVQQQFHVW
ncbi:hypothetical protein AVEN_161101-1 [Araneus ventricosus]|uniref:Uncharacterized protein n=1 Tax=Araneus ventricosus TaxID=182803 RepID=A0A4Y2NQF0_ARAVE|nr:hypothetical protein AVEN_161101-1 [Araneus ventricosus]